MQSSIFTPRSMIVNDWYPARLIGCWMAPWVPRKRFLGVVGVKFYTSDGALVFYDDFSFQRRPTFDSRRLCQTTTSLPSSFYGLDINLPLLPQDWYGHRGEVVAIEVCCSLASLFGVRLLHTMLHLQNAGPLPQIAIEWSVMGCENRPRRFLIDVEYQKKGEFYYNVCGEFSFVESYDEKMLAYARDNGISVSVVMTKPPVASPLFRCTFRFLTDLGLAHPTLRTLHIAHLLAANVRSQVIPRSASKTRSHSRGPVLKPLQRRALASMARLPHDVQCHILSFLFPSLNAVLRKHKDVTCISFATERRLAGSSIRRDTPGQPCVNNSHSLAAIYLMQHWDTPLFRCSDTCFRTSIKRPAYFRMRTYHAAPSPAVQEWMRTNHYPPVNTVQVNLLDVPTEGLDGICALDMELGFADSSLGIKEERFAAACVLLPRVVASQLKSWSAEVCWCDVRGGTTGHLWLVLLAMAVCWSHR